MIKKLLTTFCLLTLTLSVMSQTYSKDLEERAKKGDVESQYQIGLCYMSGKGIEVNYKKAEKWLKSAAKNGHSAACYDLSGLLTDKDKKKQWLLKAADSGSDEMKMNVAKELYRINCEEDAHELFTKMMQWDFSKREEATEKWINICKNDHLMLTRLLEWIERDTETDYRSKIYLCDRMMKNSQEYYAEPALEELAENGDAAVNLEVGKVFESTGKSIYKSKAKKYITKAAELGNAEALFCLGKEEYESGDKFKGKACLASAANHGYQPAKELLADYERDEKEARAAEEAKAAEEEQAKLEGRWLPSISWIKANNWNIYSEGKWNEKAIERFSAVCQGDLKAAMGLPDMDELDLLRYKQSGQYQQDLNTLKTWKDEHYAYIVDILNEDYYRTHPIVFTTNSFTIPESLGEIILPNLEKINLRLWRGRIMIPLKDGVIKELNKNISYNFKCDDIDKLYSISRKAPTWPLYSCSSLHIQKL